MLSDELAATPDFDFECLLLAQRPEERQVGVSRAAPCHVANTNGWQHMGVCWTI